MNHSVAPSKETVVLFGQPSDPAIQASAKRIRDLGRCVVITTEPDTTNPAGICGMLCTCTEPCKTLIHPSYKPL